MIRRRGRCSPYDYICMVPVARARSLVEITTRRCDRPVTVVLLLPSCHPPTDHIAIAHKNVINIKFLCEVNIEQKDRSVVAAICALRT